jgi:hypothetical protein
MPVIQDRITPDTFRRETIEVGGELGEHEWARQRNGDASSLVITLED